MIQIEKAMMTKIMEMVEAKINKFQRGPFSAQAQQKDLIKVHLLFTDHNLWLAIRYYMLDAMDTLGPMLFVLFALAVLLFVLRRRISPDMLAALAFLVPLTFYISSLYGGQAALFLPHAVPANAPYQLFNARARYPLLSDSVLPRSMMERT